MHRDWEKSTWNPMGAVTGRIRLRTLVGLRWIAIAGQTFAILLVEWGLGFQLPVVPCLAAVALSALLNVVLTLRFPATRLLRDQEATLYLAFDVAQLAFLHYLTGGIENPFVILFVAPVTISAAALSLPSTALLVGLSFVCVSVLSVFHMPLPWKAGEQYVLTSTYKWGLWTAVLLGIGFTAAYMRRVVSEASRMSDALAATQMVLAREQRLSDLGSLAAAAAHELGTPLATIQLTAKEILNDIPEDSPYHEDMALINSQVGRCREILRRLSEHKEEGDAIYERQLLQSLVAEVVAHHGERNKRLLTFFDGRQSAEPEIWRSPEVMHALENLVENAVDFARTTAVVRTRWDDAEIEIRIIDDGPGFAPDIFERLGEPYVTSRPLGQLERIKESGRIVAPEEGMGLGFFIAKTLLERTGGVVTFANHTGESLPNGDWLSFGAMVTVRWPRAALQAPHFAEQTG